MKPLLFLTASDRKSGPNKQLCQTAMSLAKEGLDVTIFIFCRSKIQTIGRIVSMKA